MSNKTKQKRKEQHAQKIKRRAGLIASAQRSVQNKFESLDQFKADFKRLNANALKNHNANRRLNIMIDNIDDSKLKINDLKALMTLRRWVGRVGLISMKEFQTVAQNIMHGLLVLEVIDIEDAAKIREELQNASFRLWQCVMLASKSPLSENDIQCVKDGVIIATDLLNTCYQYDLNAYRTVIRSNEATYIDQHPETIEKRHILSLGRHRKIVEDWLKRDLIKVG